MCALGGGEDLCPDPHGVEFLEEEFAGVGDLDLAQALLVVVTDVTPIESLWGHATGGAHGHLEWIGHVVQSFQEESGDAVRDHAVVCDNPVGEERICLFNFNVVDNLFPTRTDTDHSEVHRRKGRF